MKDFKNIITIEPGAANLKSEIEAASGPFVKACRNFYQELVGLGYNVPAWETTIEGKTKNLLEVLGVDVHAKR